ncbi:putative enoyl reductase [Tolypocladium ophioglossoides CBS 100239]|uniref:very-long-chain enoyl-CoA reductase n=1 Tax=Tolypocladium ophioglossoides (strain CBS 100239) TaxID=1163406 RepID=A0A0L0NJX8_TOLOC|nr:putative enoyl reductase [Tolypocladium ophioglossoides CBS 100239]
MQRQLNTPPQMAPQTTLKLTSRSPKQPVKRLPASLDIPSDATVEDLKILIARAAKIGDYNRIGLFDPSTKKTLKNRRARVADEPNVSAANEVLVKDLGPQVAWKTVFLVEYLGPILLHALVVAARPYIYAGGDGDMSFAQWLSFGMIVAHFVKRELETLFVHKFSANTMPAFNIFKNSIFYWALSGLLCAYTIYSPRSLAAKADLPVMDAVATAIYLFGEMGNALVHLYLSSLRSTGGTERKIPSGYGFSLVTCPNYMYEILSWVGIILASRDWAVVVFISVGAAQMYTWARGKESAYRKEFGDKYKKKCYVMLPGLL